MFIIDFIKCVIVTNLNSMFNLSLNGCEFYYFNTNVEMTFLQQSSVKLCIRFSKNLVYKSFTKGCHSSLSFKKSVQCKPHFTYGQYFPPLLFSSVETWYNGSEHNAVEHL